MSNKNETPILLLSVLITVVLIGGGAWFFMKKTANLPNLTGATNFKQIQPIPKGLFNYGGSTSWAIIRGKVDPIIEKIHPEFQLRYVDNIGDASSTQGIKMLIEGRISFAQSSRPLKDEEYQQAKQRGFNLQQIPIAIDGIAIAVNPRLNISGLSIEQLKNIYTGQITNWQQVGGNNITIMPISRNASGGTVQLFIEEVLKNKPFGKNVEIVNNTTEALKKLSNKPGAIYFASAPEVVPQCQIKPIGLNNQTGQQFITPYQEPLIPSNQCPAKRNQLNISAFKQGSYPLTRNLFVIVKQNGQIEQQAGEAYANLLLSNQGQELIAESGFVRIR